MGTAGMVVIWWKWVMSMISRRGTAIVLEWADGPGGIDSITSLANYLALQAAFGCLRSCAPLTMDLA
jgi:hypothetical protein